MRKLWSCIFYALCLFTVVFSLVWMAQPRLTPRITLPAEEEPASSTPNVAAAAPALPDSGLVQYYLCDEGGRLAVFSSSVDGTPAVQYTFAIYPGTDLKWDARTVCTGGRSLTA